MSEEKSGIIKNIAQLRERVANAAARAGRDPEDIKIIAVTKTVDVGCIKIAVEAGLADLGENRVQELVEKYPCFDGNVNWHLIGHLQTNKVKYIIDKVKLIHSLDSLELAEEIQKRAERCGRIMPALVQVNVSGEETKSGIRPETVHMFTEKLDCYKNIRIKGLMTIGPLTPNAEEIRKNFRELFKIFIDIKRKKNNNIDMDVLSMGMSNDFEIAVEEGSNMIRVGTSIFGKRLFVNTNEKERG